MLPRVARSENSPPQVEGEATSKAATGRGRATRRKKYLMNFLNFAKRFDVERDQIECLRDDSRVTGFNAFSSVLFLWSNYQDD